MVQYQGGREVLTAGILAYFEDLNRAPNTEMGTEDFSEMAYIHIPAPLAWGVLKTQNWHNQLVGKPSYERAGMAAYIDRPLRIDAGRTRQKLGFKQDPKLSICERLPVLMRNFKNYRQLWEFRNACCNRGKYEYYSARS